MPYTSNYTSPTPWVDGSGGGTPLSAAALNLRDSNVTDHQTRLSNLEARKPSYNVRDYGAVGNGRRTSDAAITTGQTALTSTLAGFAAGDVGKQIKVAGAGATGGLLTTTISAYVSATQVTLALAASTTVTAAVATWGTDDTAAVNSAMSAIKTANGRQGGCLYVPNDCRLLVSSPISLYSTVSITGAGWSNDNVYYNCSAFIAAAGFTGSAVIKVDPGGGTDYSWHYGVLERFVVFGAGVAGPHGIDLGWNGEASSVRNITTYECNSGIYMTASQASCTLEAVSLFHNNIGLNCDNINSTVRVFGLSGDNNTNLVRVKGGGSANVTVFSMKAENYTTGTGDPVVSIEDLAGGSFTVIGGWADTNAARNAIISITQPGASTQRAKVLVMGFSGNALYSNLINDHYDSHLVTMGYGNHPLIAYNINLGVTGAGNLGIGYGKTITGLQFGETTSMNLLTSGSDNGTIFYAGPGTSGGQLTDPTGATPVMQWYKSGASNLGFFGANPVAKPAVTGSRGGNAALASLLTQLAALGLITDSSTV